MDQGSNLPFRQGSGGIFEQRKIQNLTKLEKAGSGPAPRPKPTH
jgi:hypothetical protein